MGYGADASPAWMAPLLCRSNSAGAAPCVLPFFFSSFRSRARAGVFALISRVRPRRFDYKNSASKQISAINFRDSFPKTNEYENPI
jgi:hypothetical protein